MFVLLWATLLVLTFWFQCLKESLYFSWSYVSFVVQIRTIMFCLSVGPFTWALLLSVPSPCRKWWQWSNWKRKKKTPLDYAYCAQHSMSKHPGPGFSRRQNVGKARKMGELKKRKGFPKESGVCWVGMWESELQIQILLLCPVLEI